MPRPTSQDVTRISLKTNQGAPDGLGVFQSLDVRATTPNSAQIAQGLADVLGVASDLGNQHIKTQSERQAEQGIADATLGRVDDEKVRKGLAYRDGVESVTAKQAIFDARAAWQTHYAESVDKTTPTDEVARQYDAFMKEQLGPVLQANPKVISKMSGEYMRGMQETIVGHQAQLTAQHVQLATNVLQQEVLDDPENFLLHIQEHVKLTGDMDKSIATGIEALGTQAVEQGRPDLLDRIPLALTADDGKQSDNPDFNANHRAAIERYREAAHARMLEHQVVERSRRKMAQEWTWQDMLSRGVEIPDEQLSELLVKDGLWTEAELTAWRTKNLAVREAREDALMFDGLDPNHRLYMQEGMTDAKGKTITRERIQNQVNRRVEMTAAGILKDHSDIPRELVLAMAAKEVTTDEGYAYTPLKATFENVPLDDVQAFANVAAAYAHLPTTQRALYVSDPKRRADFEWFLQRRDIVGAKQAVEEIATADPELVQKNLTANRKALNESHGRIGGEYLQDVSPLAWGDDDVQVDDLVNPGYAKRMIAESTELLVGRSNMSPEAARKAATKDFIATHMLVKTDKGYRTIARIEGVTEQFGLAINWTEKSLPGIAASLGVKNLPKGARLSYDVTSRGNAALIVVDEDGMPFAPGVLRFNPQRLEAIYHRANPNGEWRKVQAESKTERERRARLDEYEKRNPVNPYLFNTRD